MCSIIWVPVFEINGALGARRAQFRRRAHDFQQCAPDVCTFFQPFYDTNTLRSALGTSRAHIFRSYAPEVHTNQNLNFEHWGSLKMAVTIMNKIIMKIHFIKHIHWIDVILTKARNTFDKCPVKQTFLSSAIETFF